MVNKLELVVGYKDERSDLKDSYYTRPFRVADVGVDRKDPRLYLVIMSSSPGILDKDCYDIHIAMETNSRLQLQSQSYQRLFTMKEGASQKMHIKLSENSELSYIQHPIVPHKQSIFKAHNIIDLSNNSIFTYGEIITCGRKHSGESFLFSELRNLTEVYFKERLIIKDNILIEPARMDVFTLGQLEHYSHQGTLIHVNNRLEDVDMQSKYIYDLLSLESDIIFGVSQPLPNVISVRVLGNGGEQLFQAFKNIEKYLWNFNNI